VSSQRLLLFWRLEITNCTAQYTQETRNYTRRLHLLHGAESFLGSKQSLIQSSLLRNQSSLPCSQETATRPNLRPIQCNPHPLPPLRSTWIHIGLELQLIPRDDYNFQSFSFIIFSVLPFLPPFPFSPFLVYSILLSTLLSYNLNMFSPSKIPSFTPIQNSG
jgi:hypothetical protein